MNTFQLTKKLISIPSHIDKKINEKEIGNFIFRYLKRIPFLTKIRKQKVEGERFNIIAKDGSKPKLLLIAHMDTVEPRGWQKHSPFKGTVKGNKLYGLGSMDMKGGMAAILSALKSFEKTKGLMLLFYCDEEYDFKGMKKFIKEYQISPQLAVSAEPTNLKIWNGARGIIKVSFRVEGKTAPASRPDQGKNVITGLVEAVKYLEKTLKKYRTKNLGPSICNLSAISGGVSLGRDKYGRQIVSQRGDAVADISKATLDIRCGHPGLESDIIQKTLNKFLSKNKFKLRNFTVYHDLSAFYTNSKELKLVKKVIEDAIGKVAYLNLQELGYQDIQMINEKLKVPSFSFGPKGGNRHQPDEWVDIKSLDKVKKVCQNLIRKYCSVL
ncbi:M20/M25/M40 family metallo-hydrolase [Patescibacteria group bacterium]|nr:M20/M25/M40 family metallo-hydrolase [Patescibacteria group bacterium]